MKCSVMWPMATSMKEHHCFFHLKGLLQETEIIQDVHYYLHNIVVTLTQYHHFIFKCILFHFNNTFIYYLFICIFYYCKNTKALTCSLLTITSYYYYYSKEEDQ